LTRKRACFGTQRGVTLYREPPGGPVGGGRAPSLGPHIGDIFGEIGAGDAQKSHERPD